MNATVKKIATVLGMLALTASATATANPSAHSQLLAQGTEGDPGKATYHQLRLMVRVRYIRLPKRSSSYLKRIPVIKGKLKLKFPVLQVGLKNSVLVKQMSIMLRDQFCKQRWKLARKMG